MARCLSSSLADKASGIASGSANEIDQVAGNAEDDIGDNIAFIRESELLYGDDSLLTVYGPLIADICANPKRFKVSCSSGVHRRDRR